MRFHRWTTLVAGTLALALLVPAHALAVAPSNTSRPTITGTPTVGATLTGNDGTWSPTPTSYYREWWRCGTDGWSCTTIPDSDRTTYTVTSADVGRTLRYYVQARNADGSNYSYSVATALVTSPAPPSNTAAPTVTGTVAVGGTLTTSDGSWSGSPTSYAYQWRRCDTAGGACANIAGATAKSYTLTSSDAGKTLRARVTATNAAGSASADSAATSVVPTPSVPTSTSPPTISGTKSTGSTLTAGEGTWSSPPTSYAYQWHRCAVTGTPCEAIPGATAKTHVLTHAEGFAKIKVTVRATNSAGTGTADSALTVMVDQSPAFAWNARPAGSWRPFLDSSPWNRQLPAAPALDENSVAMVDHITAAYTREPDSLLAISSAPEDKAEDVSRPLYYSRATDPLYTVDCVWSCPIEGLQVRIPDAAQPAGGSDGHMTVVEQQTGDARQPGYEWSFFQVTGKPAGGGVLLVTNGDRCPIRGSGLQCGGGAARYGGTAGRIRWEELDAAMTARTSLNHALFMVVRCPRAGAFIWPATKGEDQSTCTSTSAPEMGRRYFLASGTDLTNALNSTTVPEYAKVVLRTMNKYGAYVGDGGSAEGFGFQFESGMGWLSFGAANPFVTYAQANPSSSIVATGYGGFYFTLRNAINWRANLRVADESVTQP